MSHELVVPDIRVANLPVGWAETSVMPAAIDATWEDLDEYEASLRAMASYIDSLQAGDAVELEKALRIVEARRGELLDIDAKAGRPRNGDTHVTISDVHKRTEIRYRKIARHWGTIWPEIVRATERRDVTQAAILRMIQRIEEAAKFKAKQERQQKQGYEPTPPPLDMDEMEEMAVDPVAEWERAEKELERARTTIESLAKPDQGKEVLILHSRIAGLEARIQQLTTTASEARKQADAQGKVLRKVRDMLGVERNSEIVSAIQDLMR